MSWAAAARGRTARALRRLLVETGDAERVFRLSPREAAALAGEPEERVAPLLRLAPEPWLADQRRRLEAAGGRLVGLLDPEYPRLLAEIPDPPAVLFVRGRPLEGAPAVALVGARRASRQGLEAARLIADGLARAGVIVVSGFARGVDAAAHRAALAAGGATWAVFGCGVDVCYPAEQDGLLRELVRGGAALSEFAMGVRPEPYHFPVRNRLIAGLSRLVVVVEAAGRSGSLITARLAADYGRDVAAVPGAAVSAMAEGANALLKDGAILVRHAEDVLAELPEEDRARLTGWTPAAPAVRNRGEAPAGLAPDPALVLAALDADDPKDADALVGETGLAASRLSAALVELELLGLAEPLPGAVFVRRK